MNFSLQMFAVIEAIWILRSKNGHSANVELPVLKSTEVAKVACDILKRQTKDGMKPLKVRRQSWYNKNAKPEWLAIRRSINGEKPLKNRDDVEIEIAKFDHVDSAHLLTAEIVQLQVKIREYEQVIDGHKEEFEAFKNITYANQYVDFRYKWDYKVFREQFENAQIELSKEKKHRQNYQQQANSLRKERDELKRVLSAKGNFSRKAGVPLYKNFSPDFERVKGDSANDMLRNYNALKDASWEAMITKVKHKAPDNIFLIFHKFNIDLKDYIKNKIPLVTGHLNYVFACFEPLSYRRKKLYKTVSVSIATSPQVVIVEGAPVQNNVVELDVANCSTQELLFRHVASLKRGIEFYDVIDEGYEMIQIERIGVYE